MTLAQLEVALSDAPGLNEEVADGKGEAYAVHVAAEREAFVVTHMIRG
jgi:hypothetical protein